MSSVFHNDCKGFVKISDHQVKRLWNSQELLDMLQNWLRKSFRQTARKCTFLPWKMCYSVPITTGRGRWARFSIVLTLQDLMHLIFILCFSITSIKCSLSWTWWNGFGRLLWASCRLPPLEQRPSARNNCQLPEPKAANTEQAGVLSAWGQRCWGQSLRVCRDLENL